MTTSMAEYLEGGGGGPGWDTGRADTQHTRFKVGLTRTKSKTRFGPARTAGSGNKVSPGTMTEPVGRETNWSRTNMTGQVRGGNSRRIHQVKKKPTNAMVEGEARFKYRTSRFMVDPRDPFMRYWDVCSIAFLVFAALVTPYEVAFLEVQALSPLWWTNRVLDVFFASDLLLNFNLIYLDDKTQGYVTDRKQVIKR